MMRTVLKGSKSLEIIKLLEMFDNAYAKLPAKLSKSLRSAFGSAYLTILTSMLPTLRSDANNISNFFNDLQSSIDAISAELPPGSKFQTAFSSVISKAMKELNTVAASFNIDLPTSEGTAPAAAKPVNPAEKGTPAGDPGPTVDPPKQAPGQAQNPKQAPKKAPRQAPGRDPGQAQNGEQQATGNTAAEIKARMQKTAIDAAMKAVNEISPVFNGLPPEIISFVKNSSGFSPFMFSGMLEDFLVRVISSMGPDGFQAYYSIYGSDDQSGSITNSVSADFSNLGMAFMYQILDAAISDAKGQASDDIQKSTIANQAKAYEKLEKGFWSKIEGNKASAGWAPKAKAIGESIARTTFKSKDAIERMNEKGSAIYTNLYTRDGYELLYSKFIQIMKKLSSYSPWQTMLNGASNPGTIEKGAMDKLADVIAQAAKTRRTDKDAAAFIANFKPSINEFAMNSIAQGKIDSGERSHSEDMRPDAFVNYLAQEIENAAGDLNPKISIPVSSTVDTQGEAESRRLPAAPSAPTPAGGSGVGTTAFALGALILLKYGMKTNSKIVPEERLKLNVPEEKLKLNVPEDTPVGALPAPAAPKTLAPKAPAAPGG